MRSRPGLTRLSTHLVQKMGAGQTGVKGFASSSTGLTVGVEGRSASNQGGIGVLGVNQHGNGIGYGVVGDCYFATGFDFFARGAGMDYGSSSSRRWKSNIRNITTPLDKIARLRGVYFDWDADHGGKHDVGFIAEEVGEVPPEIVQYEANGMDAIGMDYSKVSPLLVEAINALRAEKDSQIAALESRVHEQDGVISSLLARVEALEAHR